MQALDLDPQLVPELGVEVGERLVEEEHGGVADQGPADRHPLALPARELVRAAVEQVVDLQHGGGLRHLALDLGPWASCAIRSPKERFSRTLMRG